jgi:uncharacterized damage-inducible protein DinB
MYTAAALADIHDRTQRTFAKLLAHCATLAPADIDREIPGFGYPTIRLQIHHVIGAERYWLSVIRGSMVLDDDDAAHTTIASLAALRETVAAATRAYIDGASADELNTPRKMVTYGGGERLLAPAHIILRTQTHVFHHLGQIAAMCRLAGSPSPGSDFPIL